MLIKLPNGDWVNPQDVTDVYRDQNDVVVLTRLIHRLPSHCSDSAATLRDQIAEQVNTACAVGSQRC